MISDSNGNNGRGFGGRFAQGNAVGRQFEPGNKLGKGNPQLKRLGKIRAAILDKYPEAASEIVEFYFAVIRDTAQPIAARIDCASKVADRIDGKPLPADIQATIDHLLKRIDKLESEAMDV